MTRARANTMEVLQGLIKEVKDNKFALKVAKDALEVSKVTPKMITYLFMQNLDE